METTLYGYVILLIQIQFISLAHSFNTLSVCSPFSRGSHRVLQFVYSQDYSTPPYRHYVTFSPVDYKCSPKFFIPLQDFVKKRISYTIFQSLLVLIPLLAVSPLPCIGSHTSRQLSCYFLTSSTICVSELWRRQAEAPSLKMRRSLPERLRGLSLWKIYLNQLIAILLLILTPIGFPIPLKNQRCAPQGCLVLSPIHSRLPDLHRNSPSSALVKALSQGITSPQCEVWRGLAGDSCLCRNLRTSAENSQAFNKFQQLMALFVLSCEFTMSPKQLLSPADSQRFERGFANWPPILPTFTTYLPVPLWIIDAHPFIQFSFFRTEGQSHSLKDQAQSPACRKAIFPCSQRVS